MDKDLMYEADIDEKKRKLWDEEYRKNREIEKRKLEEKRQKGMKKRKKNEKKMNRKISFPGSRTG